VYYAEIFVIRLTRKNQYSNISNGYYSMLRSVGCYVFYVVYMVLFDHRFVDFSGITFL